jgi:hypothetical protein
MREVVTACVLALAACGDGGGAGFDAPAWPPDAPTTADAPTADATTADAPAVTDAPATDAPGPVDAVGIDAPPDGCNGVVDVPTVAFPDVHAIQGRLARGGSSNVIFWQTNIDVEVWGMVGRVNPQMQLVDPWWSHELPYPSMVNASIAWSGAEFGFVYQTRTYGPGDLGAERTGFKRLDPDGDPIPDSYFELAEGYGTTSAVAWDPTLQQWGVLWDNWYGDETIFARVTASGIVPGSIVTLTPGLLWPRGASPLLWNGSRFVVVTTLPSALVLTTIGAPGDPLQTITIPTPYPPRYADIAWSGALYGVTWLDPSGTAYFAIVDAGGIVTGTMQTFATPTDGPGIVWAGSAFAIAWSSATGIWLERFTTDGASLGAHQVGCGSALSPVPFWDGSLSIAYTTQTSFGGDPGWGVRVLRDL